MYEGDVSSLQVQKRGTKTKRSLLLSYCTRVIYHSLRRCNYTTCFPLKRNIACSRTARPIATVVCVLHQQFNSALFIESHVLPNRISKLLKIFHPGNLGNIPLNPKQSISTHISIKWNNKHNQIPSSTPHRSSHPQNKMF